MRFGQFEYFGSAACSPPNRSDCFYFQLVFCCFFFHSFPSTFCYLGFVLLLLKVGLSSNKIRGHSIWQNSNVDSPSKLSTVEISIKSESVRNIFIQVVRSSAQGLQNNQLIEFRCDSFFVHFIARVFAKISIPDNIFFLFFKLFGFTDLFTLQCMQSIQCIS